MRNSIRDYGNHDSAYGLCMASSSIEWEYAQERPYKGDVVNGTRRMYLHLYYSVQKAADEELELNCRLDKLKSEILTDKRTEKT